MFSGTFKLYFSFVVFICLTLSLSVQSAQAAPDPAPVISASEAEQFSKYADQSTYSIDHKPWSQFLQAAVFDVGPSSRKPAPRRRGGVHTGTRVSTGSRTKYRFEGNRIPFGLFNSDTEEFLAAYRGALVSLMETYEYERFGRDEQLAFWMNLHNVILIEEIARRHPISKPSYQRIRERDNALLFDAKLTEINGVALSLNDIRYGIVYRYWRDPRVIYGFWDGSIGGVDIPLDAFNGTNVWSLLDENAMRYVNALRGVEARSGVFRVSEVYDRARILFPNWPHDLYTHLRYFATPDVAEILSTPPRELKFLPYDPAMADLSGGEVAKFGGSDNIAAVLSLKPEGGSDVPVDLLESFGAPITSNTTRGGVSADAAKLNERVLEQRSLNRREGTVSIDDVETEDPDAETSETDESPSDEDDES